MLRKLQMQGEPAIGAGTLSDLRTAVHKMQVQSTPALFNSAACRAACLFCSCRCARSLCFHSFAARLLAVPFCQPCFVQVANKNSKQDLKRGCWHRWSIRLWQWDRGRLAWLPERGETSSGLRAWFLAHRWPPQRFRMVLWAFASVSHNR